MPKLRYSLDIDNYLFNCIMSGIPLNVSAFDQDRALEELQKTTLKPCESCKGLGRLVFKTRDGCRWWPEKWFDYTCTDCNGEGYVCNNCGKIERGCHCGE